MLVPGSANPLLLRTVAAPAAGGISRSLRFNSSDSAYLSRASANITTFTLSAWIKRCGSGRDDIFVTNSSSGFYLYFHTDGSIRVNDNTTNRFVSNGLYRDPSAWYHIVVNNNGSTFNLYVNGVLEKTTTVSLGLYSGTAYIGRDSSSGYANFYLADIYFIDGQALDPSSFTETDATTGQLVKKAYTGSFTGNSFYLTFEDNSAATAAALGKDSSGLGNNWTPNNLSVTAGAGNDSLVDVPSSSGTDTGVGGEVRGNYATWNPLSKASAATLSNGNLNASYTGSSYPHLGSDSTIFLPTSGKWYWEITVTTVGELWTGIRNVVDGKQSTYYRDGSGGFNNIRIEASSSTGSANAASYTSGDIIGVAVNCDGSTIAWYKNGSQVGTTYSLTNVANLVPFAGHASSSGSAAVVANFGQRPFAYTAPSGFKALCTANLPAPLVTKPNTVMDVKLYSGTNAAQNITGLSFSPDLVWIKKRSAEASSNLLDSVRGARIHLESNTTNSEYTESAGVGLTSFNSDGFSLGTDNAGPGQVNASSSTFVSWCWDAGSSTVTNTQGSITSSVRANASAGFSVVTWNGNGNATVGHGLGVAPQLIICKKRSGTSDWQVGHASLGWTKRLALNLTTAEETTISAWNNTAPTSTVFSVGNTSNFGGDIVSYCFAPVVGYSSFGSYTGNGSTDGPFVYTGFRPRWVLIKRSDSTSNWSLFDTARDTSNVSGFPLFPNDPASEVDIRSNTPLDILSNGFKLRTSTLTGGTNINISSATYIYAAFAESPFNYSRAR